MKRNNGWQLAFFLASLGGLLANPARGDGLKLLPADTQVVVAVNFQQVRNSKLLKDYSTLVRQLEALCNTKVNSNKVAADINKSLGIDVFKDIDAVTIGASDMTKKPRTVVFVLEGSFQPEKFSATAEKAMAEKPAAVKAITIADTRVYQITNPGEDPIFVGLLNKNVIVISRTREGMASAISPPGDNLKGEIADLVRAADTKKSFNLITTSSAVQQAIKDWNNAQAQTIAPFFKDLHGTIVTANVVSEVELHLACVAKAPADAKRIAEETNKFLAAVKPLLSKQAPTDPWAAAVLEVANTLKVSPAGSTMTVNGAVSRKLVDTIMKQVEAQLP